MSRIGDHDAGQTSAKIDAEHMPGCGVEVEPFDRPSRTVRRGVTRGMEHAAAQQFAHHLGDRGAGEPDLLHQLGARQWTKSTQGSQDIVVMGPTRRRLHAANGLHAQNARVDQY